MNVPPERKEVVLRWMKKASNDLKNAQHTLQLPDPECPLDTVCFHAQQCAEKSLKAFLVFHGVSFEKIHDLGQLLHLCSMAPDLVQEVGGVERLSFYAVAGRYPEEGEEERQEEQIRRQDAEQALALAKNAYEAAERRLAPHLQP